MAEPLRITVVMKLVQPMIHNGLKETELPHRFSLWHLELGFIRAV